MIVHRINGVQSGVISMDDKKGIIYTSASSTQAFSFPENKKIAKFNAARQSRNKLSPDGRYLAIYSNGGYCLMIYDTNHPETPVFKKLWLHVVGSDGAFCFYSNDTLLAVVQNVVYSIRLSAEIIEPIRIYGAKDPHESEWPGVGTVFGLSTTGKDIVLTHSIGEEDRVMYASSGGLTWANIMTLSHNCDLLFDKLLHPRFGLCAFSEGQYIEQTSWRRGADMLCYDVSDTRQPKSLIPLKGLDDYKWMQNPQFSGNGKYLTFTTANYGVAEFKSYLYDTDSWDMIAKFTGSIYESGFSNHDEYWLISGHPSYAIPIKQFL